ncbi:MAG: GDP-mannose 4,6-dehydratase [Gammaproteobacteria bacterium]|nr:GDP-mannose 4,6-dehydratase [Gammaproteobacteria bacterium]
MKILVTGADGFVGSYVSAWPEAVPLVERGQRVDICDASTLAAAIQNIRPDAVVHLAAQSFVPQSLRNPRETYEINFFGTLNILTALRESGFSGRFLYVGSGDMYGRVPIDSMPIQENYPLRPRNPYAVSKVAAEALCYQWSQSETFEVVMVRPFNHVGPRQSTQFVVAGLAQQIAEIKHQKRTPAVDVGNIDVTRDFTDVRDVVRAHRMVLERGRNGEVYNVCSGNERSIRSILDILISISGVSVQVRQDPSRLRSAEQERVWGSYEKLHRDTGWSPEIPFEQTLRETLTYWEGEIR